MDLRESLALSATVSTIAQFLTGTQICYKIWKQRNTTDVSGFPFVAGTVSCTLWLKYGLLRTDDAIVTVNTVGLALQLAYILFYYMLSTIKTPYQKQLLLAGTLLFSLLAYLRFMVPNHDDATYQAGLMACGAGLVFFAAPMSALAEVVRSRSTETLPFPLILASFLVASQWFLYGLLIDDKFVQVPNFLGAVLSGLQLTLFAIYPNRTDRL